MTLALLLTAVTGAWATEPKVINSTVAVSDLNEGDILIEGAQVTLTSDHSYYLNFLQNRFFLNDATTPSISGFIHNTTTVTVGANGLVTGLSYDATARPATESGEEGNAWEVTAVEDKNVKIVGITYDASALAVSLNADNTEATMEMPASDVTVDYELVRDMSYKVAFSGVPTRARLAKDDNGKFHFADGLTFQLLDNIDAANPKDITSAEGITFMVGEVVPFDIEGSTYYQLDKETLVPLADFLADMKPGLYKMVAESTDENSPYDGIVYSSQFTVVEQYDLTVKPANDFSKGKIESVTVGTEEITPDATTGKVTKNGIAPDTEVKLKAKRGYVIEKVEAKKTVIPMLNAATTENIGMVVCNKGHLHDAKEAVPDGCTAVGILGKVTGTGHGLILSLKNATNQNWNTINGWTSASYAGTTLKVLPDGARGTNLTSYTTLGETTVSDWAVAQKSDYVAIFTNLGSTKGDSAGRTFDGNVNAYITTGVGGTAISGDYWSATSSTDAQAWRFISDYWGRGNKTNSKTVRPVLGF